MKIRKGMVVVLLILFLLSTTKIVKATENVTHITLNNETILVNGNTIGKETSESVYLTNYILIKKCYSVAEKIEKNR